MNKTSILIADDHKLFRETLACMINSDPAFEVIATSDDSEQAIALTLINNPDIVLMDINMTPFSGIEATQKIKAVSPLSRIIGMSMHSDPVYVKKMIKMGARGYITKNSTREELVLAMTKVKDDGFYVCNEIKKILGEQLAETTIGAGLLESLTQKEIEIAHCLRAGQTSKEIAVSLGANVKTVEVHRSHILQKLKVRNTPSLVNFFYNNPNYVF